VGSGGEGSRRYSNTDGGDGGGDRELDRVGRGLTEGEAGDPATVEGDALHERRLPLGDSSR